MTTQAELAGSYDIDEHGFLKDWTRWDPDFAERMAPASGIAGGLTNEHWRVLSFIRDHFERTGECPLVYATCRANGLSRHAFQALFPTGYMRGACKLAGITYRDRFVDFYGEWQGAATPPAAPMEKVYRVDVFGFLMDPADWDEEYARRKAREMKVPGGLTDAHLRVIHYLREQFAATGAVPTVVECCEDCALELDDLEGLFPDGYQRGAVKLAGLCVR